MVSKICTVSKSKAIVLPLNGRYIKFFRPVSDIDEKASKKRNRNAKIYRKAIERALKRNR